VETKPASTSEAGLACINCCRHHQEILNQFLPTVTTTKSHFSLHSLTMKIRTPLPGLAQFQGQNVLLYFRAILLLLVSWLANSSASAQTFPSGFSAVRVTNGISNPTAMAFAPDGFSSASKRGRCA
jgi:hypothetical protein